MTKYMQLDGEAPLSIRWTKFINSRGRETMSYIAPSVGFKKLRSSVDSWNFVVNVHKIYIHHNVNTDHNSQGREGGHVYLHI